MFPKIEHINDVIKHVDPQYFIIAEKEGYKVIDYVISCPETFPPLSEEGAAIRREFRGIIFDKEGNIIRRPWHKFFNVGEKVEAQLENIDLSKKHWIQTKLDGSMIVPFMLNDKLVWGTKMGLTDVAQPVQEFIDKNPDYHDFAYSMINNLEASPIFEWCSRQQRIVLDYPKDQLILTGMRKIKTGEYYEPNQFEFFAKQYGIPCVELYEGSLDASFMEKVRSMKDVEGFVIVFEDGTRFKIKCDWYCQLHQVKSAINQERNVIKMILEGGLDDLKGLMTPDDLSRVNGYEKAFNKMMLDASIIMAEYIRSIRKSDISRKDFALTHSPTLERWESALVFKLWEKGDEILTNSCWGFIKDYIISHCGKNSKFDELRKTSLFNLEFSKVPEWKQIMMVDVEE